VAGSRAGHCVELNLCPAIPRARHAFSADDRLGRLRYEVTQCHCTDYQCSTSSAFSIGMVVDTQAFHLAGVAPRATLRTADSGRNLTRWLCPECGSSICNGAKAGSSNPNAFRTVRAGTLDTSWLRTAAHFWTRIVLPGERSHVFDTQPDDIFAFFNLVVTNARGATT
jgi:hypothetical protein